MKKVLSVLLSLITLFSAFSYVTAEASAATVPSVELGVVLAKPAGFDVYWFRCLVTGYQIQYATKSNFSNAATVTVSDNNTRNKLITGRASECKYYVRVRGYITKNGKNTYGSWSSSKTVTTRNKNEADYTVIDKLTARQAAFSVTVREVSNATGYQVRYATKSNFSNAKTSTFKGSSNTYVTVSGRASDCKYYVQARTYRTVNGKNYYSAWSGTEDVTTRNANEANPTSVKSVTAVERGFTVSWNKVNAATGYKIKYATKSDMSNAATVTISDASNTSTTITGRASNTTYYVQVCTYRTVKGKTYESAYTRIWNVETLRNELEPDTPTIKVLAGNSDYSMLVSWNSVDKATGYNVLYATKSDMSNATKLTVNASTTSKEFAGLNQNTTYYVQVRAFNYVDGKYYNGNYSSKASFGTAKSTYLTQAQKDAIIEAYFGQFVKYGANKDFYYYEDPVVLRTVNILIGSYTADNFEEDLAEMEGLAKLNAPGAEYVIYYWVDKDGKSTLYPYIVK